MKKSIYSIPFLCFALASCQKEIDIDLNSSDPQVVIVGDITDEAKPYTVSLTKTVNFSDANNFPPISGARVVITDNNASIVDTLDEISPGVYQTNTIVGTQGHTYYLKIVAEGKTYEAYSTMPPKVNLDTVRFNAVSAPGATGSFAAVPVFLDPAQLGNNYRFIQSVNGKVDNTYLLTNDNVSNGSVSQRPLFSRDAEIQSGDSVTVIMRCIDLPTYTYFFTLSQIAGAGPGGGTTPSNPPNNITGDKALGYFAAYTTQTKKVKVP